MEERLLVKRAKRGDVDAFAELYGKIYKKLYQFALYTLKNPEDAKDAVSAAVTDAFESIGRLRKEESFSSWMYKIVANKCNQKMREYYIQTEELTEEISEDEHYDILVSLINDVQNTEAEILFDISAFCFMMYNLYWIFTKRLL